MPFEPYLKKYEHADCKKSDHDANDQADNIPPFHLVELVVEYGCGDRHKEGKEHVVNGRYNRNLVLVERTIQVHLKVI